MRDDGPLEVGEGQEVLMKVNAEVMAHERAAESDALVHDGVASGQLFASLSIGDGQSILGEGAVMRGGGGGEEVSLEIHSATDFDS